MTDCTFYARHRVSHEYHVPMHFKIYCFLLVSSWDWAETGSSDINDGLAVIALPIEISQK